MHARYHRQRGFTAVEVLMATAIGLAAMTTALTFLRTQLFALRNQASQMDLNTTTRNFLDLFAREVRRAGFNPNCTIAGLIGIAQASSTSVRLQADFNGTGHTLGSNEDLTYRYNLSNNTVERVDNNQGTVDTMVSGLSMDGSGLHYYDGAGNELVPSSSGLTSAQRSQIRRIRLEVNLSGKAVDPRSTVPLIARAATDVDVRNRYFVNSTACPGS